MYISNISSIAGMKTYKCNSVVGKYLIKKNNPLLSRDGKYMVFAYTPNLEKSLAEMPLYLRILIKGGVING